MLEHGFHDVFLASIKAIGHVPLQLPHTAEFLLECQGVLEVANLLKLVDTHHYPITFFFRYLLRQGQHILCRSIGGIVFQRHREVVQRVLPEANLRYEPT